MKSQDYIQNKKNGFTIVELLIVIVVIAILAALTIVAYNGIQSRARDADRANDISQIRKKLEIFYTLNDRYPTAYEVNDGTFLKDQLDIASYDVVIPPGGVNRISYCQPSDPSRYCYGGRWSSAGDCVTVGSICTGYWLKYRTEADPNTTITITK